MKKWNSLFLLAALMTAGQALSFAQNENMVIDTNGNVAIDQNGVTITQNGNTPLEIYQVNVPGNLVIQGQDIILNGNASSPVSESPISFERGPQIFVSDSRPVFEIGQANLIPQETAQITGLSAPEPAVQSAGQELTRDQALLAAQAVSAAQTAIQQVSSPAVSQDAVMVNLQGVQQASQIIFQENEIILQ